MPKSQRRTQKVVPGLGQHYSSPKKAAPRHAIFVRPLGHEVKKQRLTDELNKLLGKSAPTPITPTSPKSRADALDTEATLDADTDALDNFAAMDIGVQLHYIVPEPCMTKAGYIPPRPSRSLCFPSTPSKVEGGQFHCHQAIHFLGKPVANSG